MIVRCKQHNVTMESNSDEARKHIGCDWDFDPDGEENG